MVRWLLPLLFSAHLWATGLEVQSWQQATEQSTKEAKPALLLFYHHDDLRLDPQLAQTYPTVREKYVVYRCPIDAKNLKETLPTIQKWEIEQLPTIIIWNAPARLKKLSGLDAVDLWNQLTPTQ